MCGSTARTSEAGPSKCWADAAGAGIVDQHVNRAEPLEGGVDDGRGGLGVADVVLDRQQHVAEALAQVVKARDATRGADDVLAGL